MSIRARQSGVTLIELIMFIMIVSIAVLGILGVFRFTTAHSADALQRKQALAIAESLMEEVQQAYFTRCDPTSDNFDTATVTTDCAIPEDWGQGGSEPSNQRPYDNVNDYVSAPGAATAAFGAPPVDAVGSAFGGPYTASVAIQPAVLNDIGAAGVGADTEVLRITVTVSFGSDSIVLDGYRTRYAPN